MLIPPFLELGGQWWVVLDWPPRRRTARLELRRLTPSETEWMLGNLDDGFADVYARFFPATPADPRTGRSGGRKSAAK